MSKIYELIVENSHLSVPIIGWKVTGLFLDGTFSLQVSGREREDEPFDSMQIRIECIFNFSWDKSQAILDPEKPTSLCPAIDLLHKTVNSIAISRDGQLSIAFEDNYHLTVEPDSQYEAWQIRGSGHFLVISLPGGGLG